MNINTTDKVQVGDSTTSTSTTWRCPYTTPKAEQGWECPRCGRINAPWKSQCDCGRNNYWTVTDDWIYKPYNDEWWKHVTCAPETTQKAPSSTCGTDNESDPNIIYTYVTGTNSIVGGNDYWDNEKKEQTNVPKGYSNSATSVDSPWNQYSTLTSQLDKLKYEIKELKETK